MIKFHSERNINYSEIFPIFFKRGSLKESLKKIYSNKEIILTNYGRTAFQAILDRYNLKDCKIMIPAFICSVFEEIFKKNNITPVLIDVEMDTWNISQKTLERGFDRSAKALIVNNMNGLPCEIEKIKKVLNKNQIIIEDCAHSLGALHNGVQVGLTGDASFFSLYKTLPCITGGFALLDSSNIKIKRERIMISKITKLIYYLGKNANYFKSFKKEEFKEDIEPIYENISFSAPDLLSQRIASFYIQRMSDIVKNRKRVGKILAKRLESTELQLQLNKNEENVYTYFSFLLPKNLAKKRKVFLEILQDKGVIGKLVWDKPLAYFYKNECVNAKEISKRIVGIPINPNYSNKEANDLAERVLESLKILSLNN